MVNRWLNLVVIAILLAAYAPSGAVKKFSFGGFLRFKKDGQKSSTNLNQELIDSILWNRPSGNYERNSLSELPLVTLERIKRHQDNGYVVVHIQPPDHRNKIQEVHMQRRAQNAEVGSDGKVPVDESDWLQVSSYGTMRIAPSPGAKVVKNNMPNIELADAKTVQVWLLGVLNELYGQLPDGLMKRAYSPIIELGNEVDLQLGRPKTVPKTESSTVKRTDTHKNMDYELKTMLAEYGAEITTRSKDGRTGYVQLPFESQRDKGISIDLGNSYFNDKDGRLKYQFYPVKGGGIFQESDYPTPEHPSMPLYSPDDRDS